jgi:plastocyanin
LYNAPYPFVETPRPDVDDARFKKGEAFFYELQCLKCHVLGDPNVPGAQKNPTAPNLSLASRRLQRRWVRHWTQEPPIIQVGTAMPPFFTGLGIFDVHGQAWPRSQGVAEAEAQRIEKIYGNNVEEQEALLLDFIYAAGVRGYTGIQPAASATPTTPAPASAPAPSAASTPPAPSVTAPEKPAAAPTVEPKKEEPKPAPKTEEKPAPAAEKKPAAAAAAASGAVSVKGVIKLDGKAPESKDIDMSGVKECAAKHADPVPDPSLLVDDKGNLQNVVVYVSGGLSGSFDAPSEPAVLDQQGCMYHPHVLPVMVGQKIMIKNSDEFLHNVHAMANVNPAFNFGQPNKDEGKAVDPLKAAETFHVKCDVHPWMSAYIVGLENPFFGVSGEDGSFSIANLPPGDYTLTAWHETLGSKEVQVKVEAGKPAEVKISFPAP